MTTHNHDTRIDSLKNCLIEKKVVDATRRRIIGTNRKRKHTPPIPTNLGIGQENDDENDDNS